MVITIPFMAGLAFPFALIALLVVFTIIRWIRGVIFG